MNDAIKALMVDFPFRDPELPLGERVADLVSRLSLAEKTAQMLHEAPAVPALGIPAYNWWNEGLHGVARAGIATVFPQAIALAAMWSVPRLTEVATAIADEARAKHHEYLRHADHGMYKGLTFWAPNINIFRDPRWGRGHETYGECPYLTARLGVAFCRALQGGDSKYFKVVATPKHFAVHSGPEGLRHSFDAIASQKDLRETYLPAFHACVTEAKAHSVMSAYNRTNGEPCSASVTLLQRILREEWGFQGYVVSDCWAIKDLHEGHNVTKTFEESAALAVKAGCDLNCGCSYEHLPAALEQGLVSEEEIDVCVKRLFSARMQLGMFDPPERVPFASIPYEVNDSDEHRALSLHAARESIVLLKNHGGLLPLSKEIRRIAVIGPNAHDPEVLRANYFGIASQVVTPLDGIRNIVSEATKVWYAPGCLRLGTNTDGLSRAGNLSEAASMAERADVVVLCLGLSADIEGEQGDAGNSEAAGDKLDLRLTGLQNVLLEQLVALGKPTVLVLLSGSALDLSWAEQNVSAIVQAFYPGQEGGTAIAEALFGDVNPAGRLPITFPRSTDDVPPIADYSMKGRTYRYLEAEPLYPFGYGLSYTTFQYSELTVSSARIAAGEELEVSVVVSNTGACAGDEVVQLYVKDMTSSCSVPIHDLRGFQRLTLQPRESRRVHFRLNARDLSLIDEHGRRMLEPGQFRISVGGSQPDARSVALTGHAPLSVEIQVTGAVLPLPY
ncbi:MAG TPA: glycoside hydrolase family 3 C-terminal domain-containing protein [Polyangiaceae bacterium]|nr:glycoside hydrolase family 3 C-terminal domain-containing protein [Polyangiaceae bacterium]